jgi:catechol 2,3-dioxygenase-like lactoylglutathione lyase family enzyme
MKFAGISHVAYRCNNAAETVAFYEGILGMPYSFGVAENLVPSTGEFSPHIHIFIEISANTYLGFFELADSKEMAFDPNTPNWVQHLALRVDTVDDVQFYRERLLTAGVPVVGITDHEIFKSIYFRDPSGHRIEITCETISESMRKQLGEQAQDLLNHWAANKRAPDVSWHRQHLVPNRIPALETEARDAAHKLP